MICCICFVFSFIGYLYIGGVCIVLYCWLEVCYWGGEFVLCIEDIDCECSIQGVIDVILEVMDWLGLGYDEGLIYQIDCVVCYKVVVEQLVVDGKVYYVYEIKEELDVMCEVVMVCQEKLCYNGVVCELGLLYCDDFNCVICFKNLFDGMVVFDDLIKGCIEIVNSEFDDMVIFCLDGFFIYNFVVVVDDWDMCISEVICGDDYINNILWQINLYEGIGVLVLKFGYMLMILDEQGVKLFKCIGVADVMQYKDVGYLFDVLLSYLVWLGWLYGDQELFICQELIDLFDVIYCNFKVVCLDMVKLGWVNQYFLKIVDLVDIVLYLVYQLNKLGLDLVVGLVLADVVVVLCDCVQMLKEMVEKVVVWYQLLIDYDEVVVIKYFKLGVELLLGKVCELFVVVGEWMVDSVLVVLYDVVIVLEIGMGKVVQLLCVVIIGIQVSFDIFQIVFLVGCEEVLKCIDVVFIKVLLV